jgi:hypothetical protein
MKKRHIQYTMRGVGERADLVLRETALREGKSLNEAALAALDKGLGLAAEPVRHHDLDDLAGTWVHDAAFDKALRDMDRIDPELWR